LGRQSVQAGKHKHSINYSNHKGFKNNTSCHFASRRM